VTAYGCYLGLQACVEEAWQEHTLEGRRVAVQGVGKVGYHLVKLLVEEGKASVVVSDVDVDSVARAVRDFGVDTAEPDKIHAQECDIFAPCAMGSIIRDDTIPELKCRVVAGSANNQLDRPEHGEALAAAGIVYAPDYVINAGGLINVADELQGFHPERAKARVQSIYRTLRQIFHIARDRHISTSAFALEESDWIFPSYRELGAAVVRGVDLVEYLHFYRATWHGGTYDAGAHRFGHVSVPVGSQILHAVGYAMGSKMDGKGIATLVY